MKVVVTGANGFLGSWLTRRLVQEGYDTHVLTRPNTDMLGLDALNITNHTGDVLDPQSLNKAFEGAALVFHLAGVIAYRKSERQRMQDVNVLGTQNVIESIKHCRVPKLLHLSSVVAIGAGFSEKQILNERSPYNLQHLNLGYFETKRAAEELVVKETKIGNFESYIVNPSTIYGAADAKKGSRSIQLKVARGQFPFYTGGGVNVVAVEDVIDGIMLALKNGKSGERYILSGENWTIQKLFSEIAAAANVPAPTMKLPNFVLHTLGLVGDTLEYFGIKGGISRENAWTSTLYHWFDNTKAKSELGFQPRPARFAIQNSVNWIREQGMLNK